MFGILCLASTLSFASGAAPITTSSPSESEKRVGTERTRPRALTPDPPHNCDDCATWNAPRAPFRVFGNTYFVGVSGLSSILVTSAKGHVLLDGGLPQSAPLIDANIRALGFRTEDVKVIVASHAHFDHVGGIAALARESGARVVASPKLAAALRAGLPPSDDPQLGFGHDAVAFPAVPHVEEILDGESVSVGDLAITAHFTPGHTPGGTTWSWRSCEGAHCVDVVYADSLNPVSADGFSFAGAPAATLKKSIGIVRNLPCDVLLTVHPELAKLDDKEKRLRQSPSENPFIDSGSCRAYADAAEHRLDERLEREAAKGR